MCSTTGSPKRLGSNVQCNLSFLEVIDKRTLGFKNYGYDDFVALKLYSNFHQYELESLQSNPTFGGIFNLEFSLDGKLLVAACEGKEILLYDASNQKLISSVDNAHMNAVNCIRFLDDLHFATGSDDTTIKIWDIRKMKVCTRTLNGHSNWVKNIEWSEKEGVIVTSAFDGSIYAWNLNSYNENNMLYDKVFLMNCLMRMKLTDDGTKMIISTTNGYMIIIHDLDLMTLATDLRSFKPNLYRLMQISDQCFPAGTVYNYLFSPMRKRNRIEFIDDFPNNAEVISSLQIHPHGWCAVSRNFNAKKNEEWTSIHDIQNRDPADYENAFTYIEEDARDEWHREELMNHRPTDLWMVFHSLDSFSNHRRDFGDYSDISHTWDNSNSPAMGTLNSGLIGLNSAYNAYFELNPQQRNKVIRNLPRLTHYIKEKSFGNGYIKELCFSSDGRIICSPYNRGVRLLAFNERCQELSTCVPENPRQLKTVIEMKDYHKDVVVSCKFNPVHYQLVSGCLGSQIKWYQPVI